MCEISSQVYDRVQTAMWLTTTIVVVVSIIVCRGDVPYTSHNSLYFYCNITGLHNETITCKNMVDIISSYHVHPTAFRNASNLYIFGTLKHLQSILRPDTYSEMHNWKRIRISHTILTTIVPRSFYKMNNLEHIALTDTSITYVQPNAFMELPKLREVILARNKIVDFDNNMFVLCPFVRLLDFGNNRIYNTKDLAFFGVIGSVLHINLSNNRINSSFINVYQSYTDRIRSLWYAHNKFTQLKVGWFKLRKKLRVINFAYNEIGYIEQNTFKDNPNLHTIILSYNKLINIPVTMLPANFYPNLKYLAMDHNWIMGLDTSKQGPFRLLTNLTKITLAGNPFYCSCLNEVLNQIKHINVQQVCSEEEHTREICIAEEEDLETPCHLIPVNENSMNRDYFIKENTAPTSFDPLYCLIDEFIIP
ncbi:toll-like receptor 7 [Diabrotica virgifera virgifera]|uniref:Uncharacterized protein n=1 Tax=Diabrotica virgifera virgifera TaxID=50390 RepID=A0ABM5KT86_DIAVI|nr:toll-like receptor 7 [Diabrotica virgifera virgifera]